MPKIIPDVQTTIIDTTKRLLEEEGYTGLSIRKVAKACGISVGTVYNYFPNKLLLTAKVIDDDLRQIEQRIHSEKSSTTSINEFVALLYKEIDSVPKQYWNVFSQFTGENKDDVLLRHHTTIIDMVSGWIKEAEEQFGYSHSKECLALLAEIIISAALHHHSADTLNQLVTMIYQYQS